LQPPARNGCSLEHEPGLGCSLFARHYSGNASLFLGVLRCFSSPGSRCLPGLAGSARAFPRAGSPIRRSPDHGPLTAPRSFSQSTTSFIGSWRLGIHRTPLFARDARDTSCRFAFCSVIKVLRLNRNGAPWALSTLWRRYHAHHCRRGPAQRQSISAPGMVLVAVLRGAGPGFKGLGAGAAVICRREPTATALDCRGNPGAHQGMTRALCRIKKRSAPSISYQHAAGS
jgi:hypothetical protein